MKPEMIVLHESVRASMLKDTYSLGLLIVVMVLNYLIGENNWTINALGAFLAFGYIVAGRSSKIKNIYSNEELKEFAETLIAIDNVDKELTNFLNELDRFNKRKGEKKDGE